MYLTTLSSQQADGVNKALMSGNQQSEISSLKSLQVLLF